MNNYICYAPEAWIIPVGVMILGMALKRRWMVIVGGLLLAGALCFYRGASVPVGPVSAETVLCPCEGRVMAVRRVDGGRWLHVAVFLNVHNVHVQYAPMSGDVVDVRYKQGTFHPAYLLEKSALNERMETTLATKWGRMLVVQIAGLVARRCVSFVAKGQRLAAGEALGLIKFGSRVDLWLPADTANIEALVGVGDMVRVGDPVAHYVGV